MAIEDPEGGGRPAAEAQEFLADRLAAGSVTTLELRAASNAHGHGWRALQRNKGDLGIVATKVGFQGAWAWRLFGFADAQLLRNQMLGTGMCAWTPAIRRCLAPAPRSFGAMPWDLKRGSLRTSAWRSFRSEPGGHSDLARRVARPLPVARKRFVPTTFRISVMICICSSELKCVHDRAGL